MEKANETEVRFDPSKTPADDSQVEVTLKLNRGESTRSNQRRRSSEASKGKRTRCCPKLFERASGSWWNPKFNSSLLEEQFLKNSFAQVTRRFRWAVIYFIIVTVFWMIYLPTRQHLNDTIRECPWIVFEVPLGCLLLFCIGLLIFTLTKFYKKCVLHTALALALVLCCLILGTFAAFTDSEQGEKCNDMVMSSIATFSLAVETILMTYTVMPMPFLYTASLMIIFSVVYEVLYFIFVEDMTDGFKIITKLFLHICVHVMGTHIFFMSQVRTRSTFMKIGEAVMARTQHRREKQVKESTIQSLMPNTIAEKLLNNQEEGNRASVFRPFYMNRMENVSILFADIAGFTQMSANKTAEKLVGLLNDLFGRFDRLCVKNNCEKICTLGDCYYCVSGCPVAREDHAVSCVNMGLAMIVAIKDFCRDTGERVNMRVGVHTGTVLCGIIGNRRFKFDVWSIDVNIANKMEASGEPGKVHVSEKTTKYLESKFNLEEGSADKQALLLGMKTYFIIDQPDSYTPNSVHSCTPSSTHHHLTVLGNEKADSESGHSAEGGSGDGTIALTSKPLLSEGTNLPTSVIEHLDTPQENAHLDVNTEQIGLHPENGGVGSFHSSMESGQEEHLDGSSANSPLPLTENIIFRAPSLPDNDQLFVDNINEEGIVDYFQKPPVNSCTLAFNSREVEEDYRRQFIPDWIQRDRIREDGDRRNRRHSSETISTSRYNTVFDVAIALVVYTLIGIGCFLVFDATVHWIIIFFVSFFLQLYIVIAVSREAFCRNKVIPCTQFIAGFFHHWYPRHFLGAVIISLPVFAVYSNVGNICYHNEPLYPNRFHCFMIVTALLHFCNFVQLSSWLKSPLAVVCAVVILLLLAISPCPAPVITTMLPDGILESTSIPESTSELIMEEVILDIMLLLILIFFLNREFEISFRLNFYGGVEAANDRVKMQQEKEEAESLLHHIIPPFVTSQLRSTQKFSRNHDNVAVMFCSIVNFNDFYEETYEGGIECIRVLHELISDFDNLLNENEFEEVEKIKTIGSTYMSACGLHPSRSEGQDGEDYYQLAILMEFAIEMMDKIKQFNEDVLSMTKGAFNFILRIGYNHGRLTSGVIGTTKLLYDIWGDTVNVASRMDSTGVPGRIQITEHSMKALDPIYEFEYRGPVQVRGKGKMTTYLYVKKREKESSTS